jgi:hypothetical protein
VTGRTYFGIFFFETDPSYACQQVDFTESLRVDSLTGELSGDFAQSQFDFNVAQGGAILALSAGTVVVILLFASFFKKLPPMCFKHVNFFFLLWAAVGCFMTFKLFGIFWCGSDDQILDEATGEYRKVKARCFIQGGGIRMAAAGTLHLLTAIILLCMPVPTVPLFEFTEYNAISTVEEAIKSQDFCDGNAQDVLENSKEKLEDELEKSKEKSEDELENSKEKSPPSDELKRAITKYDKSCEA